MDAVEELTWRSRLIEIEVCKVIAIILMWRTGMTVANDADHNERSLLRSLEVMD